MIVELILESAGDGNKIRGETQPIDLEKYSGRWYRLASKYLVWEKDCVASIADYTYNKNKQLKIVNTCVKKNGSTFSRSGVAYVDSQYSNKRNTKDTNGLTKKNKENNQKENEGKFIVEFNDGLPSDSPAAYWVHWTDYKNHAIVGGPSGEFLWILGRKKKISSTALQSLIDLAKGFGYDTSTLQIA